MFNRKRKKLIYKNNEWYANFFEIWTKKEAVIKSYGNGLTDISNIILDKDIAFLNNNQFYTYTFKITDSFIISVAIPKLN
ncbi:MAG: 4'-phosphopantetheinyl transferase superfamily protein [Campylobacterales bacterium]|nr:4'-phosphopantetheinyl transferase superfamily protein [Campylobacterales bacterium]